MQETAATPRRAQQVWLDVEFAADSGPDFFFWRVILKTAGSADPLGVGQYLGAESGCAEYEVARPFIKVASSPSCLRYSGSFEIHEITFDAAGLAAFLASFREYCNDLPDSLTGCVRYRR